MRRILTLTILVISLASSAQTIGVGGEAKLGKTAYGLQANVSWFNISYQNNGFGAVGAIWRIKSRNICREMVDGGDFLLGFNWGTNFKKSNETFRPMKGLGITAGYATNFNVAFTAKANLQNGISLGLMLTFNK